MKQRPKLLDLFCGAGGAACGYQRAGFHVTGVDVCAQPRYCGDEFRQGDALEYLASYGREFDAIHASPPCQAHSQVKRLGKARNRQYKKHADFIKPTRKLLREIGIPFIIENVPQSPLRRPITLCGTQFGLKVYRHRLFESSIYIEPLPHYPHHDQTPAAGNGKSPKGFISVCGTGGVRGMTAAEIVRYWSMAMGITWMNRQELSQAIPPAYTEYLGKQLLSQMESKREAS